MFFGRYRRYLDNIPQFSHNIPKLMFVIINVLVEEKTWSTGTFHPRLSWQMPLVPRMRVARKGWGWVQTYPLVTKAFSDFFRVRFSNSASPFRSDFAAPCFPGHVTWWPVLVMINLLMWFFARFQSAAPGALGWYLLRQVQRPLFPIFQHQLGDLGWGEPPEGTQPRSTGWLTWDIPGWPQLTKKSSTFSQNSLRNRQSHVIIFKNALRLVHFASSKHELRSPSVGDASIPRVIHRKFGVPHPRNPSW